MKLSVSRVRLAPSCERDRKAGLIGFVSFVIDGLVRVDGVTVRRTSGGRHVLSFPARRDRAGRNHPYLRPVDDGARCAIETQVFAQLRLDKVDCG